MAEAEYANQEMLWRTARASFEQYQRKDTEYIADQLEFMDSFHLIYPDETEMSWKDNIAGQYERLVDSFGEIDQYLDYLEDGSMIVFAEQEDEPLFFAHGVECKQQRNSSVDLSAISNTLSR